MVEALTCVVVLSLVVSIYAIAVEAYTIQKINNESCQGVPALKQTAVVRLIIACIICAFTIIAIMWKYQRELKGKSSTN